MKYFIIDGNNLLGKISKKYLAKNSDSRVSLAFILDRYFSTKSYKVSLHFDGFKKETIKTNKIKLYYSNNKSADDEIKLEIENSTNRKLITLVTSDFNLLDFGKVCSCEIITSEKFSKILFQKDLDKEEEIIKTISNNEIKKLFGV